MRILSLALSLVLFGSPARAQTDLSYCDRSGDNVVTTIDALIALRVAVDQCVESYYCDSDGDYEDTASDALLLLRAAVNLPADLNCECYYIDECF
jgi:hypothetical protein